jgi:copper homeostasis protein
MPLLLEVIVQSLADARAAADGGADRLEVVRDLGREGLTPDPEIVRAILADVDLPLRVMVRESDGFGISSHRELVALQRAFAELAELRVDGAVLGFVKGATLDLDTTRAVLSAAPGLKATFHRAFDGAADPAAALDRLRGIPQIDRVLTTGGSGDWTARRSNLERLASQAGPRMRILAGGGVDLRALSVLTASVQVREVHVGRAAREPRTPEAPVSAERVRRLKLACGMPAPRDRRADLTSL